MTKIVKIRKNTLPAAVLSGVIAFPGIPTAVDFIDEDDIRSAEYAYSADSRLLTAFPSELGEEKESVDGVYKYATISEVKQILSREGGMCRVLLAPVDRAEIIELDRHDGMNVAEIIVRMSPQEPSFGDETATLIRRVRECIAQMKLTSMRVSPDVEQAVNTIRSIGLLADFVGAQVLEERAHKLRVLKENDPQKRIEIAIFCLEDEIMTAKIDDDINRKVNIAMDENQRDYYLREEIKVIKRELGEESESDEFLARIVAAKLPEEVEAKLRKEAERMSHNQYGSPENAVARAYLETCLSIPWNRVSGKGANVEAARRVLDRDHYGLEKVKKRILEYIAVKQLSPSVNGQIICLDGPPGVGKTSIASSIARSMKREFVRVSLGGVRDESDIRGHRKTYIGSMPGRIINALINAGVKNPVILLDEIDKMSASANGDPASALLEVLDSEQNKNFRDHYIELPVDLSECMFIATANSLSNVPRPLLDRMETIHLDSYSRTEKLEIAKHHLLPKQLVRHGLSKSDLKVSDKAILELCDYYTAEAGVRQLERELASLCRKAAMSKAEGKGRLNISEKNLKEYLGNRKTLPITISEQDEVGVVNGLAYTEIGGDLLKIEAAVMDGTGKLELTGSLGDVMKESAHIAYSLVRSRAAELSIDSKFCAEKDIHIHVPEGAVPKDGPSAGVTLATVLASALGNYEVRRDIAMTGELTLRGRVLAIGGLREKTLAAYTAGVKKVIIPKDNIGDLDELDPAVKANLEFIPVSDIDEVFANALIGLPITFKVNEPKLPKHSVRVPMVPKAPSIPAVRNSEK